MPAGFGAFGSAGSGYVGSGVFIPTNVAGCLAWYRADLHLTVSSSVAWLDQSGTGDSNKNLAQATTTGYAVNATDAAYNNQPTLTIGSAKALHSGTWAIALTQPFTSFIVGNYDGTASNELYLDGIDATNRVIIDENGLGAGPNIFAGAYVQSAYGRVSTPKIISGEYNGASSKIYVNSTTATGSGNAGTNQRAGITVGGSYVDTALLVGKVAELIIYDGILSAANRLQVSQYLAARYGITLA